MPVDLLAELAVLEAILKPNGPEDVVHAAYLAEWKHPASFDFKNEVLA